MAKLNAKNAFPFHSPFKSTEIQIDASKERKREAHLGSDSFNCAQLTNRRIRRSKRKGETVAIILSDKAVTAELD